ncbi:MAG: hypothetical protein IJP07_01025 [Firmicutes bacterium]|nr:hypothetical protein [Bacillota bacterium]
MKNKRLFFCLFLLCLLLLLSACGSAADPGPIGRSYYVEANIENSLQGMYEHAAFVAVGQFGEFQSAQQSAIGGRLVEERPERVVEYHVYTFHVEQIWKNETEFLNDILLVNLPYSDTKSGILSSEVTGKKEDSLYTITCPYPFYIAPEENARYLLFLSDPGMSNRFSLAGEPNRIRIEEGDILALESNLLLSDAEKEKISTTWGNADDGTEMYIYIDLLNSKLDDQISGLTLQEAQEQLGVTNVFTFPD